MSNDWIEAPRTQAKEATALALYEDKNTDAATAPNPSEPRSDSIVSTPMRIMINGIGIEVALGMFEEVIKQVLRAVKALRTRHHARSALHIAPSTRYALQGCSDLHMSLSPTLAKTRKMVRFAALLAETTRR